MPWITKEELTKILAKNWQETHAKPYTHWQLDTHIGFFPRRHKAKPENIHDDWYHPEFVYFVEDEQQYYKIILDYINRDTQC